MPGKRNKRKGGGGGREREDKRRKTEESDNHYKEIVKENSSFEEYYKAQGIVPDDEWYSFMSSLREPLPVTFRITGTRSWAQSVLYCLEKRYFNELEGLEVEGEKISPPRPLTWYPDDLAWNISLSRSVVRNSPLLSRFHSFLVKENNQGNISRQEAVSMIPPLLLGVEPHHYVLDMCAAPGSKTSQLIELLHSKDSETSSIPGGVVIANDADNSRCYTLVHQAKKLNSPCLIVTNHDGTDFPILYYNDDKSQRLPLDYDRVLCDVPCSGDGTMRKNPTIWRSWNSSIPLSLHRLQLRLLVRGLELLKPGGRIVYSTCSMNPIEDEAVIAGTLKMCKGSVQLIDTSSLLPGLKRTAGLTSWKVMSKNGDWLSSFDETPPTSCHMITRSMFPPSPQEAEDYHLQRCIRVLPHLQNTGGFFVALLCKTSPLPWQLKATPSSSNDSEVGKTEQKPNELFGRHGFERKSKKRTYREDPYVFLDNTDTVVKNITSYYNISSDSFIKDQFLSRTLTGKRKTLYLTSPLVQEIVRKNERDCKIINTGVRVFSRTESPQSACDYRITQEGIDTMLPYVSNCTVSVTLSDVINLLKYPNPLLASLSSKAQSLIESFGTMKPVIFIYTPAETEGESECDIHSPIYLAGWIAHRSVRLYVGHPDRYHYLAILGETPPETMSLKTESGQDQYSFFEEDEEKEEVLSMKEEEEKEELMEGRDEVENVVEEESEKVTDDNK